MEESIAPEHCFFFLFGVKSTVDSNVLINFLVFPC